MKILGYEHKVTCDKTWEEIGAAGRFCQKDWLIQIAKDMNDDQKISTMLHEILEALNYKLEFNLKHEIITSLESSLFQVLKDNGIDLLPLIKDLK